MHSRETRRRWRRGRQSPNSGLNDQYTITPYRAGQLRGPDKLWTERQLGTGLEGLYYGHLLTGDLAYLRATEEVVTTASRHITGDAATLAAINPGSTPFPPQNCFIHNAEQAAEGDADEPFCSGWMPLLLIDGLLAYQDQTNDPRVDEIFIRLTRFLRDTGSAYFQGGILDDDFLHPSVAYDSNKDLPERRILVPLYGAGIDGSGKRRSFGVLHHELAFCAYVTFIDQARPARDPATIPADYLVTGLSDPATFITANEIGYPSHNTSPQRKLSWWFNSALMQFGPLREAGISVPELRPGAIQPASAPRSP